MTWLHRKQELFWADEDFPMPSVQQPRKQGLNIRSILEEYPGSKDSTVLQRTVDDTVEDKAILLTCDSDYGELVFHHRHPAPQGIVYFRVQPHSPAELADIFLLVLNDSRINLSRMLTVIEREKIRQKALP